MSSESDQSDEDFIPGVQEVVSEDDSAEEETDLQYEKEVSLNNVKKRRITVSKTRQKRARLGNEHGPSSGEDEDIKIALEPEEDKKKEEDLWAQFLGGDDSKAKRSDVIQKKTDLAKPENCTKATEKHQDKAEKQKENKPKDKEARIFEFAGETVMVKDNATVSTPSYSGPSKPDTDTIGKPKPGGGLSALMNKIGKKNKLSVLEKSKLDWNNFKKDKGIEEELQTFNKGKDGYLERQDFLERADLRQFEIEKSLRVKKSNR